MDRGCPLTVRGTEAVGPGIAAADDDDSFAFGMDWAAIEIAFLYSIRQWEELHRLMDSDELTSWNRQISGRRRASGEYDSIELLSEFIACDVDTCIDVAAELDAFCLKLGKSAFEV
jgi:hypothetical protein